MDINKLRQIFLYENLIITKHAKLRMHERNIKIDDIVAVIFNGEIIKQYKDDKPFESALVLGYSNNKPIHVVLSISENFIHIITAYIPDKNKWSNDFKYKKEV